MLLLRKNVGSIPPIMAISLGSLENAYNEMPKTPEKARVDEWCSRIEDDCCSPFSLDDFCKKVDTPKTNLSDFSKPIQARPPTSTMFAARFRKAPVYCFILTILSMRFLVLWDFMIWRTFLVVLKK